MDEGASGEDCAIDLGEWVTVIVSDDEEDDRDGEDRGEGEDELTLC